MTTIVICGSMKFAKEMEDCRNNLQDMGFNVFAPHGTENTSGHKESGNARKAIVEKIQNNYIKKHYDLIKQSQGMLILNYNKNGVDNYIGGNTLMELGFAFTHNRDIFLLNSSPDVSYKTEIDAMQPIVLNNDLTKISEYYNNLPKVFVSSKNVLKVSATSLALREFNYKYNVVGIKTTSGISEQPFSIEETYQGAENRLNDLKRKCANKKYEMLVSIESGSAILHSEHNTWGLNVCIIENSDGKKSVTIDTDLEMPKEMTDLVPSVYPYFYFTDGRLTREKLLFNSVVNTLASL